MLFANARKREHRGLFILETFDTNLVKSGRKKCNPLFNPDLRNLTFDPRETRGTSYELYRKKVWAAQSSVGFSVQINQTFIVHNFVPLSLFRGPRNPGNISEQQVPATPVPRMPKALESEEPNLSERMADRCRCAKYIYIQYTLRLIFKYHYKII